MFYVVKRVLMFKVSSLSLFASSLFLCVSLTANAGSFVLNDYNVVTIGDFQSNTTIAGKAFVGGDLLGGKVGLTGNQADVVALQVNGEVKGTIGVTGDSYADIQVNDEKNNVVINSLDSKYINGIKIETKGEIIETSALSAIKDDFEKQLVDASKSFNDLEKNSEAVVNNDGNKVNFTTNAADGDYAVFHLDDPDSIFNNTSLGSFDIFSDNSDSLAGIIINVAGTVLNLNSNLNLFAQYKSQVIWNFYEAVSITTNRQFFGTLLAPLATLTSSVAIDGAIGVNSLYTTAQIHLPTTTVKVPNTEPVTEVPEPSHMVLFSLALLYIVRKRKLLNI